MEAVQDPHITAGCWGTYAHGAAEAIIRQSKRVGVEDG